MNSPTSSTTENDPNYDGAQDDNGQDESSPLDAAISILDSYIKNPALATKETLAQLKDQLISVKDDLDGMSQDSPDDQGEPGKGGEPSLVLAIKARRNGGNG